MTLRGATFQGGLALLALVAAYAVSQRSNVRPLGDVKALAVGKRELLRVRYEDGPSWVEVSPDEEDGEPSAWIRVSARQPPPPPATDGGFSAASPGSPERQLRGSKAAVELLERFTPLYATRDLGVLPPAKLKELGLDAARKKLTVVTMHQQETFDVNTSATIGAPYLRRGSDGRVFLEGGSLVTDLDTLVDGPVPGGRLLERQLHVFKLEPNDELTVRWHEKTRELQVIPSDVPFTVRIASRSQPTTPDTFAKNWHDKLQRLPLAEILGKGEVPHAGEPKVELRIDYGRGRHALGFLEMGRAGREVFVRTEHTAGWVKLPQSAEEPLLESEKIASG